MKKEGMDALAQEGRTAGSPLSSREKDRQLSQDFTHHLRWGSTLEADSPDLPVQTFDLVGQDDTCNGTGGRKDNLKGIALDFRRNGTKQRQTRSLVVAPRTQNQGGTTPGLLISGLGREGKPHDFPGTWHIHSLYHASLPWAGPVSHSG